MFLNGHQQLPPSGWPAQMHSCNGLQETTPARCMLNHAPGGLSFGAQ